MRELELVELLEELLEAHRWLQILGFSNQFLLEQKLKVDRGERDRILEAATRAVDKDARLHQWQQRLARLKGEVLGIKREVRRARRELGRDQPSAADDGDA